MFRSWRETYPLLLRKYDFQCAFISRASYSYLMKPSKKSVKASPESFSITSAPKSLKNDLASRQKRYLISMIIRTICFLLTVALPSPYRWFALVGAMFLPYIAVVIANAGRETVIPGANILSKRPRGIE